MRAGIPVVAVFDIGQANKKFLLFDKDYQVVYQKNARFEKLTDEEGDTCENLSAVISWMKQTLDDALFNQQFHIKALNFSAYGASLVHLDKRGVPVSHLYSYLKNYPEDIMNQFHTTYGNKDQIALETSSPSLGMLNSGLQLYWLKYCKPDVYKRIKNSLHLPQYCSYLITNKATSEMTSIGCHTALWNFQKNEYHHWVQKENIARLLPPLYPTHYKMDIPLGKYRFCAGVGIHNSSAALIPYLFTEKEPFLLLSTGSWNIIFNPFSEELLTADKLSRDFLTFMNPEGKPVHASRLFLGNEHDHHEKKIATFFSKSSLFHKTVAFDKLTIQKLLIENNKRKKFLFKATDKRGHLSFVKHKAVDLSLFASYEEAYYQLNIDLVAMQASSIEASIAYTPIKKLFITGRLCLNTIFIQLLASRFPEIEIYTSSMTDSSALGAALIMHNYWNEGQEIKRLFDLQLWHPHRDIAIASYAMS